MSSRSLSLLRALIFYGIFAFMALGPAYRQMGHGAHPVFRHWVMFKGMGLGVADVKFFQVLPDGNERAVDRFTVLGFSSARRAPKWLYRIQGQKGVQKVAADLCRKLGPGTDLRAVTRWSTRSGWRAGFQGEKNLCLKRERGP